MCAVVCLVWCTTLVHAQDTLKLSLQDAETQFLQKNLQLLAEKYNIDMARANVIQARVYNNPNVSFTPNFYNPDKRKYFDVGKTGQFELAVQQVITLARKRNKAIQLAQAGITLSEDRFYDLLRTLRYTLRSNLYQVFYLQNAVNAYDRQIASLEQLNSNYQQLLTKGAVTLKDATRIQALLYSIKADKTNLQNQINDVEADLQLLLQNNKIYVVPVVDDKTLLDVATYPLQMLTDSAFVNRRDLKLAENTVLYNERNYTLQKALATPDLTVGASYDKAGSYVNNATFVTVAMDLPFFNRNQGNIRAARISIDQSKVAAENQKTIVENDVQQAYVKALNTAKMLQSWDPSFRANNEKLLKSITENFEKKNISLLDFTDFYESYKDNILQYNQLQSDKMQAIEAINFAVGKTIIQ